MYNVDQTVSAYPRAFPGHIQPAGLRQVLGFINADDQFKEPLVLEKHAYLLATIKWETAHTFLPREEFGKGKGRSYGMPDAKTGLVYYGRGYIQLTWKDNYLKLGRLINQDLVNDPELACQPEIAYQIASLGMRQGLFTGKSLNDYLNDQTPIALEEICKAYIECRRIINGQDSAATIAGLAVTFERILSEALIIDQSSSEVPL